MPPVSNATLTAFTKKVDYEIEELFSNSAQKVRENLTKSEKLAIDQLAKNDSIVVKPADKGGAVVVLNKEKYIEEALRQLNNSDFYKKLSSNPMDRTKERLNELLSTAMEAGWISKKEHDFLLCEHPRIPTFYMLPKVHKSLECPPGRPIISSNGSLTEPASQFIDFHIKPLAQQLPSYIQDTTHVLKILNEMTVSDDSYLVTMDVESLYTNIAHGDGLKALNHFLSNRPTDCSPPSDFLIKLTEWTLKNNIFLFQDQLYLQVCGTAMGACFAPNYANLFLGLWEKECVYNNVYSDKIKYYGRYIDDICLIWTGSEDELSMFHDLLNNNDRNVKLSMEHSKTTINFLDLTISKGLDGRLHTTVFRKITDRNTMLRADSFHPVWLKNNIPFGQFQRLRRICDSDLEYEKQAKIMSHRFTQRGYQTDVVQSANEKALSTQRTDLFKKKKRKSSSQDQVYFVTKYSSFANPIKRIILSNWNLLKSDPTLREVFPVPPKITFRRAPTLRDKLVPSHLNVKKKTTWLHRQITGTYKCGHCNHCSNMKECKQFIDFKSNKTYNIQAFINCNTTFVVYRLSCSCGCFYIGRTKRRLKDRVSEHKNAIRKVNLDYPMAKHFHTAHNSNPDGLMVEGLETIKKNIRGGDRLKLLLQRETFYIYTMQAMTYPGLNEEIDFSPFL